VRTKKRRSESSVVQRLIDEPFRFEFVQAVRLILDQLRKQGVSDGRSLSQFLRFENSASLAFPASELENFRGGGEIEARTDLMLQSAIEEGTGFRIQLTPAFVGFLGTCGVLPYHYSERIAAHQKQTRSDGARAFIDVFSNRFVGQFYLAWRKYRLEHSVGSEGQDRQRTILLALAGRNKAGSSDDQAFAYYASLFRTRPASGHAIARVLAEYLAVPIKLEEMVGSWNEIPSALRSQLGGASSRLGFGAVLGTRLWCHDRRIRIIIGPLESHAFTRFLPRSNGAAALSRMMTLFDIGSIEVEVRLLLSPDSAHPVTLTTRKCGLVSGLGWAAFLNGGGGSSTSQEVRYMLPQDQFDSVKVLAPLSSVAASC
jgi:type VI secretion system protein ImpH